MTAEEIEAEKRALEYEAWEKQRVQEQLKRMPLTKRQLRALLAEVTTYGEPTCNHTYRVTNRFIKRKQLDRKVIIEWLKRNGGHCDCEIVYNVGYRFRDIITP